MIGIPEIILSGIIDYLLGNKGVILTYPITFIIQIWAIRIWMNSEKYKAKKPIKGNKVSYKLMLGGNNWLTDL